MLLITRIRFLTIGLILVASAVSQFFNLSFPATLFRIFILFIGIGFILLGCPEKPKEEKKR